MIGLAARHWVLVMDGQTEVYVRCNLKVKYYTFCMYMRTFMKPEKKQVLALCPLKNHDYDKFYEIAVRTMADGLLRSKENIDVLEAYQQSRQYFYTLLTDGKNTRGSFIYTVMDGNNPVGFIWYYLKFIDKCTGARLGLIYIKNGCRNRGLATFAISMIEKMLCEKNIFTIELNVFSCNDVAISLYKKLGYSICENHGTHYLMVKKQAKPKVAKSIKVN